MVFSFLKTKTNDAPEIKASAANPGIAFHGSGRPFWSGRDTASLTRTGFSGNPVGFRCVKMIAEAVAAVPFRTKDETRIYDVHPVLNLLKRPNKGQGSAELLESLIGQIMLTGNGYIEAANFNENSLPQELYVLRSDRMKVVPGRDGWPSAYEYSVSGSKHRFKIENGYSPILHIKNFHPQDDHYGFSPMEAAATAVDVHNAASKWSKALLDNAARPSGAIVYKGQDGFGQLASDQYTRLIEEIEMNHQGAKNAGRPMLLEGGLDWKQIGFSPSDMEFQKTKETAAREIALAYGVPPMLLGLPGDATYSNYQEANRAFYRQTILPMSQKVLAALSNWLSDFQEETVQLVVDLDGVQALAPERDQQWKRITQAEFLTNKEKRQMLGLPDLDDAV